jgi:hypothetical protein
MIILPDDVQRYILDFIPDNCEFCRKKIIIKDAITMKDIGEFCSKNCTINYYAYSGIYVLYPSLRLDNNKKKYKNDLV